MRAQDMPRHPYLRGPLARALTSSRGEHDDEGLAEFRREAKQALLDEEGSTEDVHTGTHKRDITQLSENSGRRPSTGSSSKVVHASVCADIHDITRNRLATGGRRLSGRAAEKWVAYRTFEEILVAVEALVAGKRLTWDQLGLITQSLPSRLSALRDATGTRRIPAFKMIAARVHQGQLSLNVVERMALEDLEQCLRKAVCDEHPEWNTAVGVDTWKEMTRPK